jgi:hypothetical protein
MLSNYNFNLWYIVLPPDPWLYSGFDAFQIEVVSRQYSKARLAADSELWPH